MEQLGRRDDGPGAGRDNPGKPVSGLGDFQILLIDDQPNDAKLFEHALEQAGTRVKMYWVATAEEGLDYLKQEGRFAGAGRVRLVVSDLSMPGMDGFQFLVQARKNPALAAIPIVILSGSRSPRDVMQCYRLGANSYITKPMSLETFVGAIGTLVRYWLDIVELPNPGMLD
jgi:CheY-like chemotaxis protein